MKDHPILLEDDVLVEEEGAEEAEDITHKVGHDVPRSHPEEQKVRTKVEEGSDSSTEEIEADLRQMGFDEMKHEEGDYVGGKEQGAGGAMTK